MERNTKNKWIQIRVTDNVKDEVVDYCNKKETSISNLMLKTVLREIRNEGNKETKATDIQAI
tara:strand:+ start:211 stop:396 length:186 start_codon:yes stop_codon:yes gene_type:complete